MQTKRGKSFYSTDTTLLSTVRNGGDLIVFIGFLHAGGRKYFFTKFGLAPESSRLVTVSMALDEIKTDIRTG